MSSSQAPRAVLAILALLAGSATLATAAVQVPADFVSEVIVSGLATPNSMAFLPDGRILFTEQRTAKVRMVVGGQIATSDPIVTVPDVNASGYERGLQGIAVDPQWPARPYVYLQYTRLGGQMHLVRYTASGDLSDPAGQSLALASPLTLIDDVPDVHANHNAGGLRFGPLGHLFLSLGDDENECAANDSTSLHGQILRLSVANLPAGGGGPVPRALITPAGNPFSTPDSNANLVWAYGLRNPWRFHVDPVTALLYVADVGEADFDEYDEVRPGDHLGWPYREGYLVHDRFSCPEPGGSGTGFYTAPIATFANVGGFTSISSVGIYRPPVDGTFNWPAEYHGNIFYGEYYRGLVRRLVDQNGAWVAAPVATGQPNADDWATGLGSAADFLFGPDGDLWVLNQFDETFTGDTGMIQRIRYVGGLVGVRGPAATARTLSAVPTPFTANVELSFTLAEAGPTEVAIFDLGGRRVRGLRDGWSAAGTQRVSWDGRDDRGAAVAPGVYLGRLVRSGDIETVRLLRLR